MKCGMRDKFVSVSAKWKCFKRDQELQEKKKKKKKETDRAWGKREMTSR
jgi:hypothetical protein